MHLITLNDEQCARALEIAKLRNRGKRKNAHGLETKSDESDLELHTFGAEAELAACQVLGVAWSGAVDVFKDVPNIQPDWEVRRRSKWKYDCLIRKDDKGKVIHVVGADGSYAVCGFIGCDEARRHDEWIRAYGKREEAWFVPLRELTPFGHSVWRQQRHIIEVLEDDPHCYGSRRIVVESRISNGMIVCSKCDRFMGFWEGSDERKVAT